MPYMSLLGDHWRTSTQEYAHLDIIQDGNGSYAASYPLGHVYDGSAAEAPRYFLTDVDTGTFGRVPAISVPGTARLTKLHVSYSGYTTRASVANELLWVTLYCNGVAWSVGQVQIDSPNFYTGPHDVVLTPNPDPTVAPYLELSNYGDGYQRIAEVSQELYWALIPTTTVTGPTSPATVSKPTITWTHTAGTDGGSQIAYRVLIYTQAQTVAGGFVVGTTIPIWDSGVVRDPNAVSQMVGVNLTTATTYVAYVQTAQEANGDHWAAWASRTFLVTIAAPATPTQPSIITYPEATAARIRVVVSQPTGAATPWNHVKVEQSVDGAVTWVTMRNADRDIGAGETLTLLDYDAPNGQLVQYRATAYNSGTLGGVYQQVSSIGTGQGSWTSTDTWLVDPQDPNYNVRVEIVSMPSTRRRIPRGVFDVGGRTRPVVVSDARHEGEATLTMVTYTEKYAKRMRALLGTGRPLYCPGMPSDGLAATYWAFGDVDEQRASRLAVEPTRQWVATVIEVDRPSGDAVAQRTGQWAYVPLVAATWADLVTAYASWSDLLTNEPT